MLLDESVPRPLADLIVGHTVTTVGQHGWAGMRNGELLERASAEFDVFVTVDKNLPQQQDLRQYSVAVVILDARTNRMKELRPLIPQLLSVLEATPTSPTVVSSS